MVKVFITCMSLVSPITQVKILFGDNVNVVNSETCMAGKVFPGAVVIFDEYDEDKVRLLKQHFVNVLVFSDENLKQSTKVSQFILKAPINPRCFYQFYTKMQKWGCNLNYGIAVCNGKLIIQKLFSNDSPNWENEMETLIKKSGYDYEIKRNFTIKK